MASFDESHIGGLAGEIRASITSDQFDLSGYTEQRVRDLVTAAFSSPLSAPTEMVRFTFVVGGGKLVRSRYSDDLPKWMSTALRDIGFSEDRSAAETFDSQGTFKQQHDTGQNLKYLIVYPRVACALAGSASSGKMSAADVAPEAQLDTRSPEYIISASELETFKEVVKSKTSSWRQCKKLLKALQDNMERFQAIEAKLCSGAPLSPLEQAYYEANSGVDAEKVTWLQAVIKKYVDEGKLIASEKQELLSSLDANLAAVAEEISKASAEGKPKKVEKLEEKRASIAARKAAVEAITPIQHRLKHGEEVQKLRVKLFPLLALEEKGRSMSLTLADLKTLEEKNDIEAAILQLENASREWFEDEEDFQAKCALELKEAKAKYQAKVRSQAGKKSTGGGGLGGKGGVGAGRSSASTGGWSTVATTKKSGGSSTASKKPSSGSYAAAFGNDSDSD